MHKRRRRLHTADTEQNTLNTFDEIRYSDSIWYSSSLLSFHTMCALGHATPSTLIDDELVHLLNLVKEAFGLIPLCTFLRIRGKTNKFECLGRKGFINRSAMKMANLDSFLSLCDNSSDILSFVDLCGGPGGFVEYFTRRCQTNKRKCVGFCISLKHDSSHADASCNWRLNHLHNPPVVTIAYPSSSSYNVVIDNNNDNVENNTISGTNCSIYVVNGEDGTGNLYSASNIEYLTEFVTSKMQQQQQQQSCISSYDMSRCNSFSTTTTSTTNITDSHDTAFPGVDIVTGDGGFSEASDQNNQELISFPLLLCQVIAMIGTLNTKGTFVLKVFACHEAPSVRLFLLLSDLFDSVAQVKPVTSRPANSEKYWLCRGFRLTDRQGRQDVQEQLWRWFKDVKDNTSASVKQPEPAAGPETAVVAQEPLTTAPVKATSPSLASDGSSRYGPVLQYLRRTNDRQGLRQLQACVKILEVGVVEHRKQLTDATFESIGKVLDTPVSDHLISLVVSSSSRNSSSRGTRSADIVSTCNIDQRTTTARNLLIDILADEDNDATHVVARDYYEGWNLDKMFA